MSVLINIVVCLSTFVLSQCPNIEEYGSDISVYAIDQPDWPIIKYQEYQDSGGLFVYRCSRQVFSPIFWGWVMIKAPRLWNIVRSRDDSQTDFIFQFTTEILYPMGEQVVFRSCISENKKVLYPQVLTISRCDMDARDLYRLLLLMGSLGMDFSKTVHGAPLGLYLLENASIAKDPSSQTNPKIDFEPLAALVALPIFPRSLTKGQQKCIIDYAQEYKKDIFLREFSALEMQWEKIIMQALPSDKFSEPK